MVVHYELYLAVSQSVGMHGGACFDAAYICIGRNGVVIEERLVVFFAEIWGGVV